MAKIEFKHAKNAQITVTTSNTHFGYTIYCDGALVGVLIETEYGIVLSILADTYSEHVLKPEFLINFLKFRDKKERKGKEND